MRKGFRILLVMLLLAVAGGIAWLALHQPREPIYQGKRLSIWLHGYDNAASPQFRAETDEAVRNIGTNAIPILLHMLRENDSSLRFRLLRLLGKQHLIKISFAPPKALNEEARFAFKILGARASNAVPELIQIYSRNLSVESQWAVSTSLGWIGPAASNAIPVLLTQACTIQPPDETRILVRISAIYALGEIHSLPETVVPTLMKMLNAHDDATQCQAALALGKFGPAAKAAAPLMIKYYDRVTIPGRKSEIGSAIKKIDPEAAAKAGVK